MVTGCRKCGAEKTEDVPHGLMYFLAKWAGYRLQRCSRCRRLRLLPRHDEPHAKTSKPLPQPAPDACPRCGQKDYRRSRRLWWERLIGRGPMVRCRSCGTRFPLPPPSAGI